MGTENLKNMKEQLVTCVQGELTHLDKVDTKELGEAIDMIKDLAEAIYYCTITDSMEKVDKEEEMRGRNYYPPMYYTPMMGKPNTTGWNDTAGWTNDTGTTGRYRSPMMDNNEVRVWEMTRDPKEGRAYMRRKSYMEAKQLHRDAPSQMKQLEAYLQQLSGDITEMVMNASPEQKTMLKQKMMNLAEKIK